MDVEKSIEFILQQQAAAEARWAESDRHIAESNKSIAESNKRISEMDARFSANQLAIQETQIRQLEMINGLIDASVKHEARSKEIDERLNALISVVDGLVRRNN